MTTHNQAIAYPISADIISKAPDGQPIVLRGSVNDVWSLNSSAGDPMSVVEIDLAQDQVLVVIPSDSYTHCSNLLSKFNDLRVEGEIRRLPALERCRDSETADLRSILDKADSLFRKKCSFVVADSVREAKRHLHS